MPTPTGTLLSRISKILGLATVRRSSRDAKVLFLQRFTRRFAYGATYVILVHFLSNLSISDEHIGLFMTLTMLGDAAISFVLTLITDQVGRRKVLSVGAILMTVSGVVFSLSSTYWILLLASVVGVISPRQAISSLVDKGAEAIDNSLVGMRLVHFVLLRNPFSHSSQTRTTAAISSFGTLCVALLVPL